jgi:DNA-binding NarL/FixJ family response regulator
LFLDLMMPGLDGWTFLQRMRALPQLLDVPIVVITAAGSHWGYPVSHVLRKPVGRNELVATIRTLIRGQWREALLETELTVAGRADALYEPGGASRPTMGSHPRLQGRATMPRAPPLQPDGGPHRCTVWDDAMDP